jgi:hypothetical protein
MASQQEFSEPSLALIEHIEALGRFLRQAIERPRVAVIVQAYGTYEPTAHPVPAPIPTLPVALIPVLTGHTEETEDADIILGISFHRG